MTTPGADDRPLPAPTLGAVTAAAPGAGRELIPHSGRAKVVPRPTRDGRCRDHRSRKVLYDVPRKSTGDCLVCVRTNPLCAIIGGDAICAALKHHLGIGNGETTPDGRITLQHVECNAACDYAPVVVVNWKFFDNQRPKSACERVDALRAGEHVMSSRGLPFCQFRWTERILAGFPDHGQGGLSPATLAAFNDQQRDTATGVEEQPAACN